jgi:DNA mismatch repair protein MutS
VVLDALEKGDREGHRAQKTLIDDLPLFAALAPPPAPKPHRDSVVEKRLSAILPDALTPREALELIYELKSLSQERADKAG